MFIFLVFLGVLRAYATAGLDGPFLRGLALFILFASFLCAFFSRANNSMNCLLFALDHLALGVGVLTLSALFLAKALSYANFLTNSRFLPFTLTKVNFFLRRTGVGVLPLVALMVNPYYRLSAVKRRFRGSICIWPIRILKELCEIRSGN